MWNQVQMEFLSEILTHKNKVRIVSVGEPCYLDYEEPGM